MLSALSYNRGCEVWRVGRVKEINTIDELYRFLGRKKIVFTIKYVLPMIVFIFLAIASLIVGGRTFSGYIFVISLLGSIVLYVKARKARIYVVYKEELPGVKHISEKEISKIAMIMSHMLGSNFMYNSGSIIGALRKEYMSFKAFKAAFAHGVIIGQKADIGRVRISFENTGNSTRLVVEAEIKPGMGRFAAEAFESLIGAVKTAIAQIMSD